MLVVCPSPGHARADARRLGPVRRCALVCLATVLVLLLAFGVAAAARAGAPRRALANAREVGGARGSAELAATRGKSALVWVASDVAAYPARGPGVVVVYLHGIHGKPENGCPWMRAAGAGTLLCPRADVHHADGTASWSGERTSATVARALRAAGAADDAPVLVGFSQGAYEVDALVRARKVRARGIVLLAGHLVPDAQALRDAGVARVVLGAATNDATYPALAQEAARLAREGVAVRLVPLGAVGHVYIADDPGVLRDAIGWAAGADEHAAEGRAGARACRTGRGVTDAAGGACA